MQTKKQQLSEEIAELEKNLDALRQEYAATPDDAPAEEKRDFSAFIDYLKSKGRI